jgi:selenocysteine lyase/cysteine desulfurase
MIKVGAGNHYPFPGFPRGVDWSAWRDEFPIFRTKTYLNTCSLGPLARRVRASVDRFLDEWEALGAAAWYDRWIDALDALRGKVGSVIGAAKEEIAIAPSVSVALSALASSIDYRQRPSVVLSDIEFPTLGHQWLVKEGVRTTFVPSLDRVTVPPERFEEAVDASTALVATSHVYYASGAIQDITRVAKAAHRHEALAVVDAYHATGQLPTDVHAAGVDAYVTGGLKWLLGGTGIAFLYVRRDRIRELEPEIAGWFGNARQWEFSPQAFEFHGDARRFELGTPAMAAVYAASAGLDLVLELGVDRLRARQSELVNDLWDRATDAGLEVKTPPDPEERAGIVMVKRENPAKDVKTLALEGIVVDSRHDRVRISPYFYSTPEDHQKVVEALTR